MTERSTSSGNVAVVIPAAGSGSRMGGTPKQFRVLGDAPVLIQTVRAFARVDEIGVIVVAVSDDEIKSAEALFADYDLVVRVVAGGLTRLDSVGAGLKAVEDVVEIMLVHDAVRPFIPSDQIRAVIDGIRQYGAAAVAVPVVDTLRKSTESLFEETVDRDGLFRMLTPQGARTKLLLKAHDQAIAEGFIATDEVEVLQRAGVDVHLINGDERNIKLTRPSDWALAEALWPDWAHTLLA